MRHGLSFVCAFLLATAGFSAVAFLQTSPQSATTFPEPAKQEPVELVLDKSIERELKVGETHVYTLNLKGEEFAHVEVEQKSIDVIITVVDPAGKQLVEIDVENNVEESETIYLAAKSPGLYRLHIWSAARFSPSGRYSAKLVERRDVARPDLDRVSAQKLVAEGTYLWKKKTDAAHEEAFKKFDAALVPWRTSGDRKQEGRTLFSLGFTLNKLGEGPRALKYFQQALLIHQEIGDQEGEAKTLAWMGDVLAQSGAKQTALEHFSRAASIRRATGNQWGEASALANIGVLQIDLNDDQKALDNFEQALPRCRAAGDKQMEAWILRHAGKAYSALKDKSKALDFFAQALSLSRQVQDRQGEAATLNNLGLTYKALGESKKAHEVFMEALALLRAAGDRKGEAEVLSSLGNMHAASNEKRKALESYLEALAIRHEVGDRKGEALISGRIGALYLDLAEHRKALDFLVQALSIHREVGDRKGEADLLNRIGGVYYYLEEREKALDFFSRAVTIYHETGNTAGESAALNNIGSIFRRLNEHQKALDHFTQALRLARADTDKKTEAVTLNYIGLVYSALGESQKAIDYFTQALKILQATNNRREEATALANIGSSYKGLGELRKSLDYYDQALRIHLATGNQRGQAAVLNNMGVTYGTLGEHQKALDLYTQALSLQRILADRRAQAYTLTNIGTVYGNSGEHQKAFDYFNQALPLRRAAGDRGGEAHTLFSWARIERNQGNPASAREKIESAVGLVESIRSDVADQDLRTSYFGTIRDYYDLYIDILMRMHRTDPKAGHDLEAFRVSERARARGLLELLAESRAHIRQGVDPKLLDRERSLQDQLQGKREYFIRLLVGKHTPEQTDETKKEIDALTDEYRQIQTKIRQTSPRYAALTQPEPLTVQRLQQDILDPDTVLLEYALGEDGSHAWAIAKDSATGFELPKRDEIEPNIRRFYDLLKTVPSSETRPDLPKPDETTAGRELSATAAALSKLLLGPVADKLGNKRLVIVADGALHYIPFAALPDPESLEKPEPEPLVVRHEIVSLPSASALAELRKETRNRKPSEKMLAILADPVFSADDVRVAAQTARNHSPASRNLAQTQVLKRLVETAESSSADAEGNLDLPRLIYTRSEANQISRLLKPRELLKILDFQAGREAATGGELSRYRYLHFATHGLLDTQRPELSSIVLSLVDKDGNLKDGFLRAFDVYNLNLPAELAVLSACKTGLGKEIRGEGLVGLTRGFMYAGTRRVVVSLWSVDDAATGELMARFYKKMLKDGMRPAAALRSAQVEMWRDKQWTAPFYWAAFILQGEWK